jgi:cystathionine beta-lyase/cystathionine gamma-synthase
VDREIRFLQNAIGGVPGPQDSYLILRGLKTLSLRVERHCQSALRVAEFLSADPRVRKVYYPGLKHHPGHEIAARQQTAFGGIVSFDLGSRGEANAFCTSTQLFALAESLGAPRSLVCHPATMTHASVEPEVRKDRGIGDGLVRLSVGLEDARDLIADIDQALSAAHAVAAAAANESEAA